MMHRLIKNVLLSTMGLLISGVVVAAPTQELGDSKQLGLGDNPSAKSAKKPGTKREEKISELGDGVYVKQYNDYGQPIVEVQPEAGPSYYYNEKDIQQPPPANGVYDEQTPTWRIKQW